MKVSHASFFYLLHKPPSPPIYVLLSAITGMIWLTLIIQTIGIYVVSSPARHDLFNVLNTAVHALAKPSDYISTSSHQFHTSKPVQHEPSLEFLDGEIDNIKEAPDSDIALPLPPVMQPDFQPYPFFVSSIGRVMLDFQCIWSYPVEDVDASLCHPKPESYRAHFSTAVRDYVSWASSTFLEAIRRSREGHFQGFVALIVIAWEVVDLTLFGGTLPTAALYACVTRKAVFLCVRAIASLSFFTKCSASTPRSSSHVRPYLRWRLRLAHGHKILRSECLTATRSARKATGSAIKLKSVSVSRCRSHVVGLKHRRPTWLSSDARFVFWERRMLKWKAIHYKWKTVEVGPWTSAPSLSSEATLVGSARDASSS